MRNGAVRTGRDDRLERDAIGTVLVHAVLEIAGDLFLRAAEHPAGGPEIIERPAGDLTCLADERELLFALHRPQRFDGLPQVHELGWFGRLADRLGHGQRDIVLLDAQPQHAVGRRSGRQRGGDVALLQDLEIRGSGGRRRRVSTIGREHGRPVGRQQQSRIAARQAGEIPHIHQPRDQGGVGVGFADNTGQPRAAFGVLSRHWPTLLKLRLLAEQDAFSCHQSDWHPQRWPMAR